MILSATWWWWWCNTGNTHEYQTPETIKQNFILNESRKYFSKCLLQYYTVMCAIYSFRIRLTFVLLETLEYFWGKKMAVHKVYYRRVKLFLQISGLFWFFFNIVNCVWMVSSLPLFFVTWIFLKPFAKTTSDLGNGQSEIYTYFQCTF